MSPPSVDCAPGAIRPGVAEQRRRRAPAATATTTWTSLVVSPNGDRRRRIVSAAEVGGWRVIECTQVDEALRRAERWRTQLAVLDLYGAAATDRVALQSLAEKLAGRPEPLLMICDDAAANDELWARQLGAWLYLPAPELGDDLVGVCVGALDAVEKQQRASVDGPARVTAAP